MQPFSAILSAEGQRCSPRLSFPLGTTSWANEGLVGLWGLEAAVDDITLSQRILSTASRTKSPPYITCQLRSGHRRIRSWYPQLRTPVREYSVGRTAMCRHLVLRDPSGSLGQILLLKTGRRRNQGIASCKPLFGERLNLKGGGGTAIDLSGEKVEILLDPSQKFTQI